MIFVPERQPYLEGWPTPSSLEVIDYVLDTYGVPGESVFLDPMCGRGTAVTRAVERGYEAYGTDLRLMPDLPDKHFRQASVFDLADVDWPRGRPSLIYTCPPLLQLGDRGSYPVQPGQWGNITGKFWHSWVEEMLRVMSVLTRVIEPGGHIAVSWRDEVERDGKVLPIATETEALVNLDLVAHVDIQFAYEWASATETRPAQDEFLSVWVTP